MTTPGPGDSFDTMAKQSLLRLRKAILAYPRALDVDYLVASVDPSGVAAGAPLVLLARVSAQLIRFGRKLTATITDAAYAAGTPLSVTVRFRGYRRGKYIEEDVTVTAASGAARTGTTTKLFDQSLAPLLVDKSNAAAGDALTCGIDDTALGLPERINKVGSVKSIVKIDAGVEQDPSAIDATTVDVVNDAIIGLTIAATDIYEVVYEADGPDGWESKGALAG